MDHHYSAPDLYGAPIQLGLIALAVLAIAWPWVWPAIKQWAKRRDDQGNYPVGKPNAATD